MRGCMHGLVTEEERPLVLFRHLPDSHGSVLGVDRSLDGRATYTSSRQARFSGATICSSAMPSGATRSSASGTRN